MMFAFDLIYTEMKKQLLFILCLATLFLSGCKHSHNHDDEHGHSHGENCSHGDEKASTSEHVDEIIFTPEQAQAAGLKTAVITPSPFRQVIKTSGQIFSAQGDEVTITATSSGIVKIEKASLTEGSSVRKGEELLNISSRNIESGDPIQKARMAFEIAKMEYDRAVSLRTDQLISEKEFNEIKLVYEDARLSYQSFSQQRSDEGAEIYSPITGYVRSILVNEGDYVNAGQALFTISKNKKLQLSADVSERYYSQLKHIQSANFKSPYQSQTMRLADLNGKLVSYGRSTSSQEFTIPINFEFDNIGETLAGSYVEVFLLGSERPNVISVPTTALMDEQGLFFVYKQLDEEGYQRQEVKLGQSDGRHVEILQGLSKGDVVVTEGAYHVKLASASASIPHGHEH